MNNQFEAEIQSREDLKKRAAGKSILQKD